MKLMVKNSGGQEPLDWSKMAKYSTPPFSTRGLHPAAGTDHPGLVVDENK